MEPIVRRCTACAETGRLKVAIQSQARMAAGTGPGAQDAIELALAGVAISVAPFDPHRSIGVDRDVPEEE